MDACMQMMERSVWKPSLEICPNCPRCGCSNTKFCYYNNYSLTQPRYFCKGCRRYWTKGGSLRNVPVGGGCRKSQRGITTKSLKLSTNGSKTAFGYGNIETTTNTSIASTTIANDSHIDVALVYANFLSQNRYLSKGNVLNNNNGIGSEILESLGTVNVDHFDHSLEFDSHIMTSTRALGSSNIDELMPQINIAADDDHNQVLPTENHDHQVFLSYQDRRSYENSCAGDFGLLFTPTLLASQNALSLSSSHHIQTMEASRDDHVPMVAPEEAFNNQQESLLNNDNYWTPLIDIPITIDHDTVSGRT